MSHPRFTTDEIVQHGETIYERELRQKVEPQHEGKFLVLDIETGEYEIDPDEVQALKRAMARHPDGARYIKRVGYPAAHRLGGRFPVNRP